MGRRPRKPLPNRYTRPERRCVGCGELTTDWYPVGVKNNDLVRCAECHETSLRRARDAPQVDVDWSVR